MWQAEHNAEQLLSSLSIEYRGKKKAQENPKSRITKAEWRNRCAKNLSDLEEDAIATKCLEEGSPYITDVVDPITFKCMENPVVLADHRCYDMSSFKGPMKEKDPLTNLDWEPTSWHQSSLDFETGESFYKFCKLNRWKNARDDVKDIHVFSDAFKRNVINAFADTIKIGALPNLEVLFFYDDHIDKNGMTIFANLFKGATLTNLKSFVVEYETISSDAAQKLATAVLNKPTLESFGRIPIKQLLAKELPELDLSRYGGIPKVGVPEALVLKQLLPVSSLTSLDLAGNKLRAEGAKALADGGAFTGSLTSIDLAGNQLCGLDEFGRGTYTAEGIIALAPAIRDSGSLTSLNLDDNFLNAEGAKALAPAIRNSGSLTSLNLVNNNLRAEGAKVLAPAIRDSSSLTSLNLKGNGFGSAGAKALIEGRAFTGSLTSLDLSSNFLKAEGAKALVDGGAFTGSLTSVDLAGNKIGGYHERVFIATPEGPKALAEAIAVSSSLTSLGLGGNNLKAEGAKALVDGGAFNGSLTSLDLSQNSLRAEGAKALVNGGAFTRGSLTACDLRINSFDEQSKQLLRDSVKGRPSFKLELSV